MSTQDPDLLRAYWSETVSSVCVGVARYEIRPITGGRRALGFNSKFYWLEKTWSTFMRVCLTRGRPDLEVSSKFYWIKKNWSTFVWVCHRVVDV